MTWSTTASTCTSRSPRSRAASDRGAPAIDRVEALRPRHIVAGHQNEQRDDDAGRTIAETRQYLDDAQALLQTERTAVDFFNAKVERYPDHLGRYVLWAGAQTLYGVPEHPEEDPRRISVASWL